MTMFPVPGETLVTKLETSNEGDVIQLDSGTFPTQRHTIPFVEDPSTPIENPIRFQSEASRTEYPLVKVWEVPYPEVTISLPDFERVIKLTLFETPVMKFPVNWFPLNQTWIVYVRYYGTVNTSDYPLVRLVPSVSLQLGELTEFLLSSKEWLQGKRLNHSSHKM